MIEERNNRRSSHIVTAMRTVRNLFTEERREDNEGLRSFRSPRNQTKYIALMDGEQC